MLPWIHSHHFNTLSDLIHEDFVLMLMSRFMVKSDELHKNLSNIIVSLELFS